MFNMLIEVPRSSWGWVIVTFSHVEKLFEMNSTTHMGYLDVRIPYLDTWDFETSNSGCINSVLICMLQNTYRTSGKFLGMSYYRFSQMSRSYLKWVIEHTWGAWAWWYPSLAPKTSRPHIMVASIWCPYVMFNILIELPRSSWGWVIVTFSHVEKLFGMSPTTHMECLDVIIPSLGTWDFETPNSACINLVIICRLQNAYINPMSFYVRVILSFLRCQEIIWSEL